MSWPIRLHDARPESPQIGDMYPAPWMLDAHWDEVLSDEFKRGSRKVPLVVRLPGGYDFCIDSRARSNGVAYGDGWHPTGEGAAITLTPSINIGGLYHGWIQNGVISDDCEGRTFP